MRRYADMRYVGQGFEIEVPLADGAFAAHSAQAMRDAFLAAYRTRFEREIREVPTEALTWRLSATAPVPNVTLNFAGQKIDSGPRRKGLRKVYFPESGFVALQAGDGRCLTFPEGRVLRPRPVAGTRWPVVVFVRGGLEQGDRLRFGSLVELAGLAERGYIVLVPEYGSAAGWVRARASAMRSTSSQPNVRGGGMGEPL